MHEELIEALRHAAHYELHGTLLYRAADALEAMQADAARSGVAAMSDKMPEPVAFIDPRQLARGAASLHCVTKPEYRSWADAQAGVEYRPVYTADQLREVMAVQAKKHSAQDDEYDKELHTAWVTRALHLAMDYREAEPGREVRDAMRAMKAHFEGRPASMPFALMGDESE
jgi:hypothetical protein